ncbi:polymorphic toxin-type HINT domain-containing protein [Lignipirellula cremea]|uniref:Uncharacterized protein n=1 Tax=Lignipirellula cremea TaxID=2528010 RepID=A0A518DV06_9BACT|nr:polymorphic toxin-type HINT domain-containing protein [Lignipirellula cremea]QDU95670.1 hypothetical protein Pla8534_34870 [Lignipirellula cremea]
MRAIASNGGHVEFSDAISIFFALTSAAGVMRGMMRSNCFIAGTQVLIADHVIQVAAETSDDLLTLLLPSLTIAAGAATLAGVGLAISRRKKQQDGLPPGGPPRRSTTQNLLENGAKLMDDLVDDVLYGFGASPAPQLAGLPVDWEDLIDDSLRQASQASLPSTTPPSTPPALRRSFPLTEEESTAAPEPAVSPATEDAAAAATTSSISQKSSSWLNGGILLSLLLTLLFGSAWAWTANRDKPAPTVTSQTVYTTRNIEDIKVGDTVVSFNEETGENERKPVTDTFDRVSDHLRILEIETADGEIQTLETTDEHPFFTPLSGWVNAGDLQVGDTVFDHQRQAAIVQRTEYEPHPDGVAVYNFTVDDSHTYYVADANHFTPLLVHNAGVDYGGIAPRAIDGLVDETASQLSRSQRLAQQFNRKLVVLDENVYFMKRELVRQGYQVLKVTPGTSDSAIRTALERSGARFITQNYKDFKGLEGVIRVSGKSRLSDQLTTTMNSLEIARHNPEVFLRMRQIPASGVNLGLVSRALKLAPPPRRCGVTRWLGLQ